jgi:hypothetical protein
VEFLLSITTISRGGGGWNSNQGRVRGAKPLGKIPLSPPLAKGETSPFKKGRARGILIRIQRERLIKI